jgi:thymidylate synthase (FAD)
VKIDLLDHGFVRFVEAWGHGDSPDGEMEAGIIEAARQSTQGSFRGWEKDASLLAYLYNNKHSTPFEFAGMIIEVKAPIFVFREWHRHRTQSYNEMSARYAPLPAIDYIPTLERLMMNTGKQGGALKDAPVLTEDAATEYRAWLGEHYSQCEESYQTALGLGVPKELARIHLPVGRYSQMRAQANLRNWLAFLTLRMDPAAQWEIRQYAMAVGDIIEQTFPRTYDLFIRSIE